MLDRKVMGKDIRKQTVSSSPAASRAQKRRPHTLRRRPPAAPRPLPAAAAASGGGRVSGSSAKTHAALSTPQPASTYRKTARQPKASPRRPPIAGAAMMARGRSMPIIAIIFMRAVGSRGGRTNA